MTNEQAFKILGINEHKTYQQGYRKFRHLAKIYHPDKGGDKELFQNLKTAWDQIKSILPKKKLVVLIKNQDIYYIRWIQSGIYGDWIQYKKNGNTFHITEKSLNKHYDIKEKDKILENGKNCILKIMNHTDYIKQYENHNLWEVQLKEEK